MADSSPLPSWRQQAARFLSSLIIQTLTADRLTPTDGAVDELLRLLADRPPRPEGRDPYLGLFPASPLPALRQRAATGIQVFLERLTAPDLIPADERADDLIRTLKALSPRPLGVHPYEGLFGRSHIEISDFQIQTWRNQAALHLQWLVLHLGQGSGGDEGTAPGDILADDLLRALGRQPARTPDRLPYRGLFLLPANATTADYRPLVAKGLKVFVERIPGKSLGSQDAVVDAVIRKLRGLSDRPVVRLPYEGLFHRVSQITVAQLRAIAPYAQVSRLERFVPHLNTAMTEFDIDTPLRRAHFLAQLAHESGEFNYVEEIASGTAYEGRADLGNTQPGDGVRFKGRGLIQITGRFNYRACGEALGVDLIQEPERLSSDVLACRSAGWFWDWQQINRAADADDVERVTYIINGGYNGFRDRVDKLTAAKKVLGL
ncbi:MAG: glycoside hydrolase family 19 protein [Prochlorothrix sp.]|nr:glycoside hydrolase family 19 protein [Prochlorothrix sp.]